MHIVDCNWYITSSSLAKFDHSATCSWATCKHGVENHFLRRLTRNVTTSDTKSFYCWAVLHLNMQLIRKWGSDIFNGVPSYSKDHILPFLRPSTSSSFKTNGRILLNSLPTNKSIAQHENENVVKRAVCENRPTSHSKGIRLKFPSL